MGKRSFNIPNLLSLSRILLAPFVMVLLLYTRVGRGIPFLRTLGLDLTYKEMAAKVSVTSPTDTRIVAITVKDHDPVMAMDIANALREVASSHIQNVMNIEAVNVVETANMPTTKAGPPVVKWSLIGGIAGVFLVSVISVLQYLMDDTIKSAEDVQRYLGLSTLALIPVTDEVDDTGRVRKKRG